MKHAEKTSGGYDVKSLWIHNRRGDPRNDLKKWPNADPMHTENFKIGELKRSRLTVGVGVDP